MVVWVVGLAGIIWKFEKDGAGDSLLVNPFHNLCQDNPRGWIPCYGELSPRILSREPRGDEPPPGFSDSMRGIASANRELWFIREADDPANDPQPDPKKVFRIWDQPPYVRFLRSLLKWLGAWTFLAWGTFCAVVWVARGFAARSPQ
jgi:hypothetical protein